MTLYPHLDYESALWDSGYSHVAGVDEVGRGAFAGPVVAAAVVFPANIPAEKLNGLKDSKALTANKREHFVPIIEQHALHYSLIAIPANYINRLGILKATFKAMRHAVIELTNCDFVLVDGYSIPNLKGFDQTKQTAIIKGDTQSLSIAAASVLAKVYRDDLMSQLHPDFTPYHWHTNKGYGTRSHCQAILDHGLTKHHRLDFVRNLLKQKGASQTNS